MKKSLKFIFTGLSLCVALLFCACKSPAQYQITATTSDPTLGSVVEAIDILLNKKNEGTNITLHAKENKKETNPFVCWIKDNNKVVGAQTELPLTYNASTEGNYTAVFHENESSKMMFASLANISINPPEYEHGYDNVEYEIKTGLTGLDLNTLPVFATGHFSLTEQEQNTNNLSVLYFGTSNKTYATKAIIKLTSSVSEKERTLIYNFAGSDAVNENNLEVNKTITIRDEGQNRDWKLTLTFEKLSSSTAFSFWFLNKKGCDNSQSFLLKTIICSFLQNFQFLKKNNFCHNPWLH